MADAFFFDFRFFAITVYIVPLYRMGYIHDYIISQVDEICKATATFFLLQECPKAVLGKFSSLLRDNPLVFSKSNATRVLSISVQIVCCGFVDSTRLTV